MCDPVALLLREIVQAFALWQILPDQPVGVLVRSPLPGVMRRGDPIPHMNGGGNFELVFLRRKAGRAGTITYTAEFSSSLQSFSASGVTPTWVADSSIDPDYEIVKVAYLATLPDGQPARFGRVRVENAP